MDGPQSFGQWLRQRRRELDLTQDALARQVGCARVTVRKLEADEIRPSRQLALLLVEHLQVPPAEREKYIRLARGGAAADTTQPAAEPRHNLPHGPSSFIGRQRELAAVRQLLQQTRLVTLTGTGGIGKTRLAIEVATELVEASLYPDGVWWVELAPLRDPSLVAKAVAKVRDVSEVTGQPIEETLANRLRAQRMLLVLDNCEHLILACAQLADRLLNACPKLQILATSREALDILGETTWQVPSLSLPEAQPASPDDSWLRFESVQLFSARARLVQPGFELTSQNLPAVAQICRRLSGMPLAIELAAARMKMMSVDEIARRLDDRFDLLTAGSRTALPRQQTLRATIDWSFDLLPEPERVLFRRLAVFAGGFTLPAVEAIMSDEPVARHQAAVIQGQAVLGLLGQLVNKSLVNVEPRSNIAAETRYGMLETVREYARQKLEAAGEYGAVQDRHLDYFTRLAEAAEPELLTASQMRWFLVLEVEIDNLRAAMDRSMDDTAPAALLPVGLRQEAGLRLIAAVVWFFERVYRREACERMIGMLSGPAAARPTLGRARALTALGFIMWELNEFAEARARLEEALPVFRGIDDRSGIIWALAFLGWVTVGLGDYAVAQSSLEEGVAIARELGPAGKPALGVALAFYGDVYSQQGDDTRALEYYMPSVSLLKEIGENNLRGHPVRQIGYIALRRGDLEQARAMFADSLNSNHQVGHQLGVTAALMAFGMLALHCGQEARAARLAGAVEARLAQLNAVFFTTDSVEYHRFLSALRSRLSELDLAAGYAEGRAMSLDQTIEFALQT